MGGGDDTFREQGGREEEWANSPNRGLSVRVGGGGGGEGGRKGGKSQWFEVVWLGLGIGVFSGRREEELRTTV